MKFKLLVNPQKEELVQAQVHQENDFTQELKKFVLTNGSSNQLLAYDDKDVITLSLDKIALITIIDNKTYAICTNKKQYQISRFEETQTAGVNIIMKNGLIDYISRRCFAKIRKELG